MSINQIKNHSEEPPVNSDLSWGSLGFTALFIRLITTAAIVAGDASLEPAAHFTVDIRAEFKMHPV